MESGFVPAGTLERPRGIGRAVRLLLGVGCLRLVWEHLANGGAIASAAAPPSQPVWWLLVALGISVFGYVVNIGFTLNWGRWPQYVLLALAVGLGVWGWVAADGLWSPALGWLVVVWISYTFGHLGISFVLSSVLGTPGCEMRAIPHLFTVLTGRATREHSCPGFLRRLDEWELERVRRRARLRQTGGDSHVPLDNPPGGI